MPADSIEKRAATAFFEDLINARRYDRIAEIFTEDCITNDTLSGHAGVESWLRSFHDIFPDCFDTITGQWQEGNEVVTRIRFEGTHSAPWMGYPASGQKCVWQGVAVHTIRDGRIARKDTVIEQTHIFRQLGWLKGL
jgi:steroid delta-isomerase-like uncharacterized protein